MTAVVIVTVAAMVGVPISSISDPRYVKAVSHPLRVRILALVEEGTASPRELAERLEESLGIVSYHVRRLHDVGLLELVRTTQVRGAIAHHYRAKLPPKADLEAWTAAPPVAKQARVGAELQTIGDYARASAAAGGFDRCDAKLVRSRALLDECGWQEMSSACERLMHEIEQIEAAAAERIQREGAVASEAALAVLLFESVGLLGAGSSVPVASAT